MELAIFGSFMVSVLGVIVSYGMNYNFTQQAIMEAFRAALASANTTPNDGTPTAVSNTIIRDRHIPNPTHPFGVGQVIPVISAAGVTKNFRLDATADTQAELPSTHYTMQGATEIDLTTAGFRTVPNPGDLSRFYEIYGSGNVRNNGGTVTIIDACEGQVISYDVCVRQARMINDPAACSQACQRSRMPGNTASCDSVCSGPIDHPWYADEAALNNFFLTTRATGVQADAVRETIMANSQQRSDAPGAASTTDALDWRTDTTRTVIEHTGGGGQTSGTVTTSAGEQQSTSWSTPW